MKAIFYYNTSEAIKVDKDLEYIAELDIVFKTSVSLKNPIIDLELKFQDNKTLIDVVDSNNEDVVVGLDNDSLVSDYPFSITDFNYCYIPSLDKYYYINNPILVTSELFRLELTEDVLMSLKTEFRELDAFVTRNEFTFDKLIKDDLTNFRWSKSVEIVNVKGDASNLFSRDNQYSIMFTYLTDTVIGGNTPYGPASSEPFNKSTNYLVLTSISAKNLSKLIYNDDTKRSFVKNMKVYPYSIRYSEYTNTYFDIGTERVNISDFMVAGERYKAPIYLPEYLQIGYNYYYGRTNIPSNIDFLDYEPFSKYELWIPFHRWIEIDANYVLNKLLEIRYVVDYDSGTSSVVVTSSGTVIYTNDVELGVDIPLSTTNQREANDKALSMGLNTGIGLIGSALSMASLNPIGVASGVLSASKVISSAVTGFNTNYVKANGMTSNSNLGYYNPYVPQLRITRNIPVGYNSDYFHLKGRPLYQVKTLSSLSGFTQIDDIHLENIKAFQDEKDELYNLLKSGIIL